MRIIVKIANDKSILDIPNADGMTPKDLILMYRVEKTRNRMIMVLNNDGSMSISSRGDFSRDYKTFRFIKSFNG